MYQFVDMKYNLLYLYKLIHIDVTSICYASVPCMHIFGISFFQIRCELEYTYQGKKDWFFNKAHMTWTALHKIYVWASMSNYIKGGGGMLPKVQVTAVLSQLPKIFLNKTSKNEIYVKQQPRELLSTLVAATTYPRMIETNNQIIMAVGQHMVASKDIPQDHEDWGYYVLIYLGIYYMLSCNYPDGYQTGLLFLQSLIFGEEDISASDRKAATNFDMHMESFKTHWRLSASVF